MATMNRLVRYSVEHFKNIHTVSLVPESFAKRACQGFAQLGLSVHIRHNIISLIMTVKVFAESLFSSRLGMEA